MARQKRLEADLTESLLELCGGVCEVCNEWPDFRGLGLHHITFRSRGGAALDPLNTLLGCGTCHDHVKYPMTGTPLSTERQLEIAANR